MVDVRDVGTQDERGTRAGERRVEACHPGGELDRVGRRVDEHSQRGGQVLDPLQERSFVEEPVVDRDVEAAAVGSEEPGESRGRHGPQLYVGQPPGGRVSG